MTYKHGKAKSSYQQPRKRIIHAFSLKPVGPWTRSLLKSDTGKYLNYKHLEAVAERLKKTKPTTKAESKKAVKEAMNTPAAQFLVLYELSLTRPLTEKEFLTYLSLFRELFPEAYKSIYGDKTPPQIVDETRKIWKMTNYANLKKAKR